eukprot:2354956-Rhodomonas_salina.1
MAQPLETAAKSNPESHTAVQTVPGMRLISQRRAAPYPHTGETSFQYQSAQDPTKLLLPVRVAAYREIGTL